MFARLKWKLALLNVLVTGFILLAMAVAIFLFLRADIVGQSKQAIGVMTQQITSQMMQGTVLLGDLQSAAAYGPFVVLGDVGGEEPAMLDYGSGLTGGQRKELLQKAQMLTGQPRTQTLVNSNGAILTTVSAEPFYSVLRVGGRSFRCGVVPLLQPGGTLYTFYIFQDLRQEQAQLWSMGLMLAVIVLVALGFTLLGGLFLAARTLRPVRTAWQKQREFVADASHELRSPLAALRCSLDVLLDEPAGVPQDKHLYLRGAAEETDRMTVLVDELLLLARADSGATPLLREPIRPDEQARIAVHLMEALAAKKSIALRMQGDACPVVLGDGERLRQVFVQLLDNAIKYTPSGGHVTVVTFGQRDRAIIEVRDDGMGIPPEHQEKIFERFYRVDRARTPGAGGHGLGLPIARWIVGQHGGTLTVRSAPGEGSVFTVSLPAVPQK